MADIRGWGWCAVISLLAACSSFNAADPGKGSSDGGADLDGGSEGSVVTGEPDDHAFTITAASIVVTRGDTATLAVTVKRGNNLSSSLSVRLTGTPSGVTADPVTSSGDSASLTIHVDAAQPQGTVAGSIEVTIPHSDNGESTTLVAPLSLFVRGKSGELDTTFGTGGIALNVYPAAASLAYPQRIVVAPDDSLYLIGYLGTGGDPMGAVAHVDPQGKLDPTYGTAGIAPIFTSDYQAAALQADGKLVIVGGPMPSIVARLNKDGSPDTKFGPQTAGAGANVVDTGGVTGTNRGNVAVAIRYDGDIFVEFINHDPATNKDYAGQLRLSPDGSLRTTYGSGGGARVLVQEADTRAMFARNDPASVSYGSIVHVDTSAGGYSFLQRTADNTPDPDPNVSPSPRVTSFLADTLSGRYVGAAVMPDGSCVVPLEEASGKFFLRKFDPVGNPPASAFGTAGVSEEVVGNASGTAAGPDGSTFVSVYQSQQNGVLRFKPDGSRDTSWNVARIVPPAGFADPTYQDVVVEKSGRVVTGFLLSPTGNTATKGGLAAFWL